MLPQHTKQENFKSFQANSKVTKLFSDAVNYQYHLHLLISLDRLPNLFVRTDQCGISSVSADDVMASTTTRRDAGVVDDDVQAVRHDTYIIGGEEAVQGQFPWQVRALQLSINQLGSRPITIANFVELCFRCVSLERNVTSS